MTYVTIHQTKGDVFIKRNFSVLHCTILCWFKQILVNKIEHWCSIQDGITLFNCVCLMYLVKCITIHGVWFVRALVPLEQCATH